MKKNKGISLISLTITVAILIILSSMFIYNSRNGIQLRNLKQMENDIELLDDKVSAYYQKNGTLPIGESYNETLKFTPEANDNASYYIIDLSKLNGVTLNRGKNSSEGDVYIINEQSHHIYYVKGVKVDGVIHYSINSDNSISIKDIIPPEITSLNTTTNSISIVAVDDATEVVSGIMGYAITENNIKPTQSQFNSSSTLTKTTSEKNLQQDTTYFVWAIDNIGNISDSKSARTKKVTDLTTGNTTFTPDYNGTTNQDVTVTVTTTETNFTIQTSKDGTNWETKNTQTFSENGKIYARLIDTTEQAGAYVTYDITNIDKSI